MLRTKIKIYKHRWHVFVTLAFLAAPFVFFLVFSRFAHVTLSVLMVDILVSLARMVIAYGIAVVLGWLFAVLFYRGQRATVALPLFDVLQSMPTYAALPLAVAVWGASNLTVVTFLVLAIIWPIFFSVVSSLKLIKRDWQEAVQIARLSGFDYFKNFLWPASVPGLITGSIIGLGDGWEALVATEIIVGIKSGLGNFFQIFSQNPTITIFGIFGLLIIIFTINKLVWLPLLEWSHRVMEE